MGEIRLFWLNLFWWLQAILWSVYREYNESYGQEYRTILFAAVDYTAKTAKPEYRQGQCRPGKLCFPRALNHGEPWACVEFMIQKKKKKKKKKLGLNYWLSYFQVETGSTAMVFPMDIDIISTWDSTVSEKRQNKMIRLWMGVLSAGKRRREFLLLMSMETRPSLVWCCKRITASNKNIIVG